jgi:Domain of unknown function (DUF4167)
MRGRNRKGGHHHHNPLTRVYESNGPDVKIRGTANHVAEKYVQLARDAQASGDPVSAENYYQHAEHYFRMIAAAHEQFRQNQPQYYRQDGGNEQQREESNQDSDDEGQGYQAGGNEPGYGPRESQHYPQQEQPYPPREPQPYGGPPAHHQQQHHGRPQHSSPQQQQQHGGAEPGNEVDRLPSFITGGAPQQHHQPQGPNGFDNQPDRFPLHRRRRRHRGPHRGDSGPQRDHDEPGPRGPSND